MWPDDRLCRLFGITHPVIQAPMAGSDTPALTGAVTEAGGLGSVGAADMTPETLPGHWRAVRARTAGPVNLNFFAHRRPEIDEQAAARARALVYPFYVELDLALTPEEVPEVIETRLPFGEEMLAAVLALDPPPAVASFHFGLPDEALLAPLRARGIRIIATATTVDEARELAARGVDAIVAQGIEAGGHQGFFLGDAPAGMGLLALVRRAADAVPVPVIAAGGIMDGRGIAAALAAGAAGVQMGTAFLGCPEAALAPSRLAAMRAAEGHMTRLTRAFSGGFARAIVNRFVAALAPHDDELPAFPLMDAVTGPLRRAARERDLADMMALYAGQGVGLLRELPAADLVAALAAEAAEALAARSG